MNKPIAWMRRQDGRVTRITLEKIRETDEPLYTLQVPLSIEQINDIHMETNGNINPIDFAKGIERAHGIK